MIDRITRSAPSGFTPVDCRFGNYTKNRRHPARPHPASRRWTAGLETTAKTLVCRSAPSGFMPVDCRFGNYRHRVGRGRMTVSSSVVGKPGFHRRAVGGEQRTSSTRAMHWVAGEARARILAFFCGEHPCLSCCEFLLYYKRSESAQDQDVLCCAMQMPSPFQSQFSNRGCHGSHG